MRELSNLLQIKKLIALICTICFAVLSFRGDIASEQFITIFSVIIGFYYGQSSVRQAIKEK